MQAISEKIRSSRAWSDAEGRVGLIAVVLLGTAHLVPRYLGDDSPVKYSHNEHGWNVAVGVASDIDEYVRKINSYQRDAPIVPYRHVWVKTREHGNRIASHMDESLCGVNGSNKIKNRWRWVDADVKPSRLWNILIQDAIAHIELNREQIDLYDDGDRDAMIWQRMRSPGR